VIVRGEKKNADKTPNSSEVHISLTRKGDAISLSVEDNGVGFDVGVRK
jgi:signal transduction histidine kinase